MNRLEKETSPYLRQHQNNPVDWFPWGEEAFRLARETNRPILLSVGYAACHWCHVMAHESFENAEIAAILNEHFVSIKVDREERPELDRIYQPVAQVFTGGGGWPLTVFLTPDQKPFFGGTYFPPEDSYGRAGFRRVLLAVLNSYRDDPEGVARSSGQLTEAILEAENGMVRVHPAEAGETVRILSESAAKIHSYMDPTFGGIGRAPKFPNVPMLTFLWRSGRRDGVILTLRRMAEGGIFDQLGGGFHRYAVDEAWAVPHFEKMLSDNGLLLKLYSEILLSGASELKEADRELFTQVITSTVDYLLRDLRSPAGTFFSSQDADSEGEEGKFYVWTADDLSSLVKRGDLSQAEAAIAAKRFGISAAGNFEQGKTVLFAAKSYEAIASELEVPATEVERLMESVRRKLLRLRSERVSPQIDDKVLVSWNALAISGLSWASGALSVSGESSKARVAYQAAKKAYDALVTGAAGPHAGSHRLSGTIQHGIAKTNATLDDYAFLTAAALDLARWSPESEISGLIEQAHEWLTILFNSFQADAGFYFTGDDHETLLFRPRGLFDSAIPAGTAVALASALVLAEISGKLDLRARAEQQLRRVRPLATGNPSGGAETLSTLLLYELGPVVVSGPNSQDVCRNAHVFRKASANESGVIVCHGFTCGAPHLDAASAWRETSRKVTLESATGRPAGT
ncbi:MAG: hypothetical protein A2X94_15910 [Bdellovibrionales bacterium GWB1_55_8]|nr:MAG: hypothetical protein A2X94_15910 [Bdellovibrionales bacterium GWB1_55_8]